MTTSRVRAVHPQWSGCLRLSPSDATLVLEAYGSTGRYVERDGVIVVSWDRFPAETFIDASGVWVHRSLIDTAPRLDDVCVFSSGATHFRASEVTLRIPGSDYEVSLRTNTSDMPTFEQVFGREEYDSLELPREASTIIDLGANIGLSAVYFGLRYPSSQILALEPSRGNYRQLLKNVAGMRGRVRPVMAAAWHSSGSIDLQIESETGDDLGEWGGRVSTGKRGIDVACLRPADILDLSGFDSVDILKVDIEGAELELFGSTDPAWLDVVDLVIVETHDRFRPESDAAVRNALAASFETLLPRGENLFFRNRNSLRKAAR